MSDSTNPYAPPRHEAKPGGATDLVPTVDGSRLRFGRTVALPRVCVGCGATKRVTCTPVDLEYIPPAVWLAFPLIGVLGAALLRSPSRRARVRIPRCPSCNKREESIKDLRGPAVLGLVVVLLVAATLAGNGLPVTGGIVAVLALLVFVLCFRRWLSGAVSASYIDEGTVTLSGIHPAALAALATHEGAR